jgi:serine/threonine protein kinase
MVAIISLSCRLPDTRMEPCPNCGMPSPHNGPCPQSYTLEGQGPDPGLDLASALPGQILDRRYQIAELLGEGGMGKVFLAHDLRLSERRVVVKQLRDDFYREEDKQKALSFFKREMEMLVTLDHPSIVKVIDYFHEEDNYYLVMDYIEGSNLHQRLHKERGGEPFDEEIVVAWTLEILDVLSYMHSRNVIYRDLKPSNIMIDVRGQLKLIDFGIARTFDEGGEGTHVVSAGYSPPEQYWGGASPQSDIYALGGTMHFLLSGTDPQPLTCSSPRTLNPAVSEYIDGVVRKSTAQDINERYADAMDMREALLEKDYVSAPQTPQSRWGEIIVGIVLLAGACVLLLGPQFLEQSPDPKPPIGKTDAGVSGTLAPAGNGTAGGVDRRVEGTAGTGQDHASVRSPAGAAATDLARQVTDEKDLTDPAGLPTKSAR